MGATAAVHGEVGAAAARRGKVEIETVGLHEIDHALGLRPRARRTRSCARSRADNQCLRYEADHDHSAQAAISKPPSISIAMPW
jgi:hypothetical protein